MASDVIAERIGAGCEVQDTYWMAQALRLASHAVSLGAALCWYKEEITVSWRRLFFANKRILARVLQ